MQDAQTALACLVAACASILAIVVLRRFCMPLGLIDHPDERKQHVGKVPLVGGLAIYLGMLAGALCHGQLPPFALNLLGTAGVLALLGALDDRNNLSVMVRLLVQTVVILTTIVGTGVYIRTLGHLFGFDIRLGWLGIPFTVIAIIGLLNAFNLMDGIDGLAGTLALVAMGAIRLFAGASEPAGDIALIALLAAAILPYLATNLGLMGQKIFLGDAGSMAVGYLLAWVLIHQSQLPDTRLSPVNVLWCVALPTFDTLAVMFRRLRQRRSPFQPDRGHIHHLLLQMGLGPRRTLLILLLLAVAMASMGILARLFSAGSNLLIFCILLTSYVVIMNWAWGRRGSASVATP